MKTSGNKLKNQCFRVFLWSLKLSRKVIPSLIPYPIPYFWISVKSPNLGSMMKIGGWRNIWNLFFFFEVYTWPTFFGTFFLTLFFWKAPLRIYLKPFFLNILFSWRYTRGNRLRFISFFWFEGTLGGVLWNFSFTTFIYWGHTWEIS